MFSEMKPRARENGGALRLGHCLFLTAAVFPRSGERSLRGFSLSLVVVIANPLIVLPKL